MLEIVKHPGDMFWVVSVGTAIVIAVGLCYIICSKKNTNK